MSCGSPPADLRTLVPGDALVFLETNDLGRTIGAITESARFAEFAKTKPNTAALNGIKVAIAVTGFETSEQPLTDEDSVLNFQPHFVAVAETNAWSWQTTRFAEDQLGEFVNEIYGGEVEMESVPKDNGRLYTWKAVDGRMAYAYLEGSLVFFGNDLTSIEKCLAVKRGETESIAKNQKIKPAPDSIGYGYISTDGVAQLANIAGVTLAMKAGEESDVKSFMARVIPEILRGSVTDVTWTATSTADGRIEDRYVIGLEPETLKVFAETLGPSGKTDPDLSRFVPKEFASTTIYNFADPRIAWRSVVLTAQKRTDQISGSLLNAFSGSLFEPYGIDDPELFLSAAGPVIQTIAIDDGADNVAVVASFKDLDEIKKSIAKEVNFIKPPEKIENADVWRSADNEIAAAVVENRIIVGDAESVIKCLAARNSGDSLVTVSKNARLMNESGAIVTLGRESDPNAKMVAVLSERKSDAPLTQEFLTTTRFNQFGVERTTSSEFGLIGLMIAQLGKEQ